MIEKHTEYLKEILPKYLSPEQEASLFSTLKDDFPYSKDPYKLYRELDDKPTLYQGDAILDIPFPMLDFSNGEYVRENFSGAILSNTCDIAGENSRNYTPKALFAAIYTLGDFTEFLKESGFSTEKIESFAISVRDNNITSLFYLPEFKSGDEIILPESFVRFDHTASIPIDFLSDERYNKEYVSNEGDRLFTFSNYGFYLFIFKLSVHFCRFKEGVFRN